MPAAAARQQRIPAKAAIVVDSNGEVLYAKYPDAKLAPASTVKLVTAMVVIDRLDPAIKVKISRNAGRVRSIQPRLYAGEEVTVSDLLHLALMKSINSAAVALAEAAAGSEKDFVTFDEPEGERDGTQQHTLCKCIRPPEGDSIRHR